MAENYNLGSKFGFNIAQPKGAKNAPAMPKVDLGEAVGNLFDSMTSYVDKYEDVLNGNVAKEIGMYSRQAMIVGMNLKASDKNIRNFDMNI
jgi:hypothetical protein